jgi:anaerobic selenocysteine-containing dehydrogenase
MADTLTLETACPLDCPDGCSLTVTVNAGRLLTVDATPPEQAQNPLTAGFICQKVKRHAERVYGVDRVLTPLMRVGEKGSGNFRKATWDEALEVIAQRMRDAIDTRGPGAILPYLYNSSVGVLGSVYGDRFCAELQLPILEHTICAATMGAAKSAVLRGLMSADPRDIEHAKYIVVWGANPTISNTHLPPLINRAVREGGAKLVVIDPRRTGIAQRAHRHLAIRPGTDVVLAAALAHVLQLEGLVDVDFVGTHSEGSEAFLNACVEWTPERAAGITGLDAHEIVDFAREWAAAKPAMLRIGWGMERNFNGGHAIMSALALPVLMGHFGIQGSGILHSTGSANGLNDSALTDPRGAGASASGHDGVRRVVSQNDLGEVLNTSVDADQISVLIVQGANPAIMNLDQQAVLRGLARNDLFTVVHEQVMTDTCLYADVILPATTHFESTDLVSAYGSMIVQRMPAVIDRVGESRTNAEFFAALASHFGLTLDADAEAMIGAIEAPRPFGEPRQAEGSIQMLNTFPEGERKFHLVSPIYTPVESGSAYPLVLLSPASNRLINSMFGERYNDAPVVHIHPDDAASRSIVDGQRVVVFNDLAEISLVASVNDNVRCGVVAVAKGYWSRSFGRTDGLALNALIARSVEPLAGGACFNDARVDLRVAAM